MRNHNYISQPSSASMSSLWGGGISLIVSELHSAKSNLNTILNFRLVSSDTGSVILSNIV